MISVVVTNMQNVTVTSMLNVTVADIVYINIVEYKSFIMMVLTLPLFCKLL